MLSRMAPSSPPAMRTFHLLKTPDILCANDTGQPSVTTWATIRKGPLTSGKIGADMSACGKLFLAVGWQGGWMVDLKSGSPFDSDCSPTPATKTCRWGPRYSHPSDEDLSLGAQVFAIFAQ